MMNFTSLQSTLRTLDHHFKVEAGKSVNRLLTIRNWLFGFYIVEFQQNGEDRAAYGERLLQKLAEALNTKGFSFRNLKLYRQFYQYYPQLGPTISTFLSKTQIGQSLIAQLQTIDNQPDGIGQTLSAKYVESIGQSLTDQLQNVKNQTDKIGQSVIGQFGAPPEKILSHLSYTHLTLIMALDEPLKRAFYEIESIKGGWGVRELKRQIGTLLYERTGLSNNKEELLRRVHEQTEPLQPADFLRSPYVFEFLELPDSLMYKESDLEKALIDHLQMFILELGEGFCFEARQKRVMMGNDWHFVDLVFYHRILKCHVLVDLKTEGFKPAFAGNMNAYINYYKEEMKQPSDNEPVGLLLCTDKNESAVRYALGGLDEKVFVSQYKLLLPDEATLKAFIERERDLLM